MKLLWTFFSKTPPKLPEQTSTRRRKLPAIGWTEYLSLRPPRTPPSFHARLFGENTDLLFRNLRLVVNHRCHGHDRGEWEPYGSVVSMLMIVVFLRSKAPRHVKQRRANAVARDRSDQVAHCVRQKGATMTSRMDGNVIHTFTCRSSKGDDKCISLLYRCEYADLSRSLSLTKESSVLM